MELACFYDNLLEAAKQENKDITDILQQVREMGITSVECSIEALLEDEVKMKVMLAEADLTVSAVYGKLDFGTAPDASYGYSLVDTAVSFGCKKVEISEAGINISKPKVTIRAEGRGTYNNRESLRKQGFRYDSKRKCWERRVPAEELEKKLRELKELQLIGVVFAT